MLRTGWKVMYIDDTNKESFDRYPSFRVYLDGKAYTNIGPMSDLELKNIERKEQARLDRERLNAPRFHPMYEAKLKSQQAEQAKLNKKK
jgi:hypothetical protein